MVLNIKRQKEKKVRHKKKPESSKLPNLFRSNSTEE